MKKITNAIIWRKSIYDRGFSCRCGAKLMLKNHTTENVVANKNNNCLFCAKCGYFVATYKLVPHEIEDGPEDHLMGNWEDKAQKYLKDFEDADRMLKIVKEKEKQLNKKLAEISALESKTDVLENKCRNKDTQIKEYAKRLQELTKENVELSHRLDKAIEANRRGEEK